uniref:uncharacterized protein LOC122583336 n=1 Tax=Erigeron canadensis TaxID=72917 RepID=UPI001CB8EE3A|nr:uncharacterized protein LOC122583336 [Erigeron canadensis]
MSDSSASSSSSSDYEATEYESINRAVSQMNAVFNPEAITACLNVIFDEEENEGQAASSSSTPKLTRRVINRDHLGAAKLLYNHYFAPNCTYPPDMFRRRFKMRKEMFLRIARDIHSFNSVQPLPKHFQFFHKAPTDASGRPGFNIFQKCTSAIRQLAYSYKADALDDYLQMAQDTAYQCLDAFCKCVIHLYQEEYLRRPTEVDIQRITAKHEQVHGFPGMLGSIDCMHWGWRNCPVAWQEQYTRGDKGHPTIMLEADRAPKVEFTVNGRHFGKGYYLANGIYPEWATLVKSFKCPMEPKTTKFKRYQEAARKDIERAFGVLQGCFQIVEQQARAYSVNKIKRIMLCCVILHNMIVEDNGRAITAFEEELIANTVLPTRTWNEGVQHSFVCTGSYAIDRLIMNSVML